MPYSSGRERMWLTATRRTAMCRSCVPNSWYDSARNWQAPSSTMGSCARPAKLSRSLSSLIPATMAASRSGSWSALFTRIEPLSSLFPPAPLERERITRNVRNLALSSPERGRDCGLAAAVAAARALRAARERR
eukprot:scaffold95072_cov43-Tisochrysis_lutea.AAC.1